MFVIIPCSWYKSKYTSPGGLTDDDDDGRSCSSGGDNDVGGVGDASTDTIVCIDTVTMKISPWYQHDSEQD